MSVWGWVWVVGVFICLRGHSHVKYIQSTCLLYCTLSKNKNRWFIKQRTYWNVINLNCTFLPDFEHQTFCTWALFCIFCLYLSVCLCLLLTPLHTPTLPPPVGRVSLTQGASLLVEQLTLEDEGWFECRILVLDTDKDDFQNGTWTFLSITGAALRGYGDSWKAPSADHHWHCSCLEQLQHGAWLGLRRPWQAEWCPIKECMENTSGLCDSPFQFFSVD